MQQSLEFFTSPDGTVYIKPTGEAMYEFNEHCTSFIEEMLASIRERYPEAFKALSEEYANSARNPLYYKFRIVHRFIRCNFGEYDALHDDVTATGNFNLEEVKCPLRGECKFEGVICHPKLDTHLSDREKEVVECLCRGMKRQEIADTLYISICTVNRHIQNIMAKSKLSNATQIVAKFNIPE